MSVASALISAGSAANVLLIGSETMSLSLDVTSRSTAFLFGDGAGAVVIGPAGENGISPTVWGSDGETPRPSGRPSTSPTSSARRSRTSRGCSSMEGPRVFRWAAITLPKALSGALDVAGLHADDIEVFIPIRPTAASMKLMKKNLRLRDDVPGRQRHRVHRQHLRRVDSAGHGGDARHRQAEGGQTALMLGFGAGLSHAAQVVTLPPAPKITSFDDQ